RPARRAAGGGRRAEARRRAALARRPLRDAARRRRHLQLAVGAARLPLCHRLWAGPRLLAGGPGRAVHHPVSGTARADHGAERLGRPPSPPLPPPPARTCPSPPLP